MKSVSTGAPRIPRDLYPTPPDAAIAIGEWLRRMLPVTFAEEQWHDPAAGFGTLLEWAGVPRAHRWATELGEEPVLIESLRERVRGGQFFTGTDALDVRRDWPRAHIIANPPFALLYEFVERALDHVQSGHLAAVLIPMGWWHATKRLRVHAPNYQLALSWRPQFRVQTEGSGGTFQDFVWSVWSQLSLGDPEKDSRWRRLLRPAVPPEVSDLHMRLLGQVEEHVAGRVTPMPLFGPA